MSNNQTPPKSVLIVFGSIIIFIVIGVILLGRPAPNDSSIKSATSTKNNQKISPAHSQHYSDVSAWMTQYGSFVQTIQADNSKATQASSAQDYASLQIACGNERTDIEKIAKYPAIPDANAAKDMATFVTEIDSYTNDCVDGTVAVQQGEINQDASKINEGTSSIISASAHLKAGTTAEKALNADLSAIIASN